MNDIKEDLNIMELEGLEFLGYSFQIIKRNFLNFLPVIIIMILFNLCNTYSFKAAYKFSDSSYGMKIYRFFADLKIGWFIDEGRGEEWASLGLFNHFLYLSEFIYLFFFSILCSGIVISICKYIDQGIKTNPLSEIKNSAFKILKFLIVEFLAIGIIKTLPEKNKFIQIIVSIFLIFVIIKCIFFFQEYFYQKNSMIKAIKNSSAYSIPAMELAGLSLAYFSYQLLGMMEYYSDVIGIPMSVFFQLMAIILITLNYFNIKYLNDTKILEEIFQE